MLVSLSHTNLLTHLNVFGTEESRPDQAGPFAGSQHERTDRERRHVVLELLAQVVPLAGVVHQDDLLEQGPGRPVDDAPDGSQQRAPGFVVEHDHDRGGGQFGGVVLLFAAGRRDWKGIQN